MAAESDTAHLVLGNDEAWDLLNDPSAPYYSESIQKTIVRLGKMGSEGPQLLGKLPCGRCAVQMIVDPRTSCDHELGMY